MQCAFIGEGGRVGAGAAVGLYVDEKGFVG
jgi:hypothetical protein